MKIIKFPTKDIVPIKIVHDKRTWLQKLLSSPKESYLETTVLNGRISVSDIEIESDGLNLYEKIDLVVDDYQLYGVLPISNIGRKYTCKLDHYEIIK